MTAITIRGIEEDVKHQLEITAKQQGLALSSYLRMILNNMVNHNSHSTKYTNLRNSPIRDKFQETSGQKAIREIREIIIEDTDQSEDLDWNTFFKHRHTENPMTSTLDLSEVI